MRYQDFEEHVSDVADLWNSRANRFAMSGLFPPFYIYYLEREGLRLVAEGIDTPDPAWKLGSAEPIRANNDRANVRRLIWNAARRLPILSD